MKVIIRLIFKGGGSKMKKLLLPIMVVSSLYAQATKSSDEWSASGRLNAYLQNINVVGNDSANRDGTTHNEELSLHAKGGVKDGVAGVDLRVRGTNDKRIQKDGATILYLHTYYKDKAWNLEAGDVASSLNPYVFSASLKGAKVEYRSLEKKDTLNYAIIAGVKKAAWRDFYYADANEAPSAQSGAFAVTYLHERAKEIRLSAAAYKDDLDSGGADARIDGKKGYTFGLDGKWRFNKYVTLKGYGAYATGTQNLRANAPYHGAGAVTLKLFTRPVLRSLKSNFIYQRVSAKYIQFQGTGPQDKEAFENANEWRINKQFKARLNLKATRDNVDNDDLNATQKIYYEQVMLSYYPEFIKRANVDMRFSNKDVKGRGADDNQYIASINMLVRSRSGLRYGGGYEYTHALDKNSTATSSKQIINNYNVLVGYKAHLSKVRSYRVSCKLSYRFIFDAQDTVGVKLDAGYTHNKRLSADFYYLLNNTDRVAQNDTKNSTYQLRGTYKLDAKGRDVVRLLLEKRDVNVDNDVANSYDEYIQKISLVMNF